jgi:hypothetical protein
MAAPKRSVIQIERDRVEIARLYLQGVIQVDIAARLGMTRQMVGYDLKAIRAKWLESSLVNFNERVAIELAKIDNLEVEYWQAWQRSLQVKESSTAKVVSEAESERNEVSTKQEQMTGNESFLAGIRWCIDRRLKLFGLDAPVKIDWRQTLPDSLNSDEVQRQFLEILTMAAMESDATTND